MGVTVVVLLTSTLVVMPTVAAAPAGGGGQTSWVTAVSDHHEFIGGGESTLYASPDYHFRVVGNVSDGIRVEVDEGEGFGAPGYELEFRAPVGEVLTEGEYEDASGTQAPSEAVIDVASTGRGCTGPSRAGTFVVRDIDPALQQLWITYDFRCQAGATGVRGEVRINEPAGTAFELAPSRHTFGEQEVGETARLTPVTLRNTGAAPVRVDSIEITAGAPDFSVAHDTCGLVAARDSCHAFVRFLPSQQGRRAGVVTFRTDHGAREVPLEGYATPRGQGAGPVDEMDPPTHAEPPEAGTVLRTVWRMEADPDSWIGNPGAPHSFVGDEVQAYGGDTFVNVDAEGGGDYFDVYITADDDHLLLPGTTVNPVRNTYPDGPYDSGDLRISGNHRGCSIDDTTFTVHEATYDEEGDLAGVALTFRERCLPSGPQYPHDGEVRGVIAWNASFVPPMPRGEDRRPTAITFNADRSRRRDEVVRFRGQLEPPRSGRRLVLERRPPGRDTSWSVYRRIETERAGRYLETVRDRRRGLFRVRARRTPRWRATTTDTVWVSRANKSH